TGCRHKRRCRPPPGRDAARHAGRGRSAQRHQDGRKSRKRRTLRENDPPQRGRSSASITCIWYLAASGPIDIGIFLRQCEAAMSSTVSLPLSLSALGGGEGRGEVGDFRALAGEAHLTLPSLRRWAPPSPP